MDDRSSIVDDVNTLTLTFNIDRIHKRNELNSL